MISWVTKDNGHRRGFEFIMYFFFCSFNFKNYQCFVCSNAWFRQIARKNKFIMTCLRRVEKKKKKKKKKVSKFAGRNAFHWNYETTHRQIIIKTERVRVYMSIQFRAMPMVNSRKLLKLCFTVAAILITSAYERYLFYMLTLFSICSVLITFLRWGWVDYCSGY